MNVNHNNLWSIGWPMGKSDYFWWLIFKISAHSKHFYCLCFEQIIIGTKRLEKRCSPKHNQELSTKSTQKFYEINWFLQIQKRQPYQQIYFLFVQVYKTLLLGHNLPRSHF